jgi:hypothetical protein
MVLLYACTTARKQGSPRTLASAGRRGGQRSILHGDACKRCGYRGGGGLCWRGGFPAVSAGAVDSAAVLSTGSAAAATVPVSPGGEGRDKKSATTFLRPGRYNNCILNSEMNANWLCCRGEIGTETHVKALTPYSLFEYLFTSFGLSNATQTFQRMIDRTCANLEGTFPYST